MYPKSKIKFFENQAELPLVYSDDSKLLLRSCEKTFLGGYRGGSKLEKEGTGVVEYGYGSLFTTECKLSLSIVAGDAWTFNWNKVDNEKNHLLLFIGV